MQETPLLAKPDDPTEVGRAPRFNGSTLGWERFCRPLSSQILVQPGLPLVSATPGQRLYNICPGPWLIASVEASLGTAAASGSTVVEVYKDGVLASTLTLAALASSTVANVALVVERNSYVQARVTSVGSGAADLSVQINGVQVVQDGLYTAQQSLPMALYDAEAGQPKNVGYVQLNGVAGDYISTPDSPLLDVTGDIEIVARVMLADWTPSTPATIVAKEQTTSQRSYRMQVTASGYLSFSFSLDGSASLGLAGSVAVPVVDGQTCWVRSTREASNGRIRFFWAPDQVTEPSSWTQLGADANSTSGALFVSTSQLEIGGRIGASTELLNGKVHRVIVRNGIGGATVADFDARNCYGPGYLNAGTLPVDSGGSKYVPLSGQSGDYVWTADKPALRITGDIEIVARVALDDWTPSTVQTVVARWSAGASGKSYNLSVGGSVLILYLSTDGTTTTTNSSTAAPAFTDGSTGWIKATRRSSDGRIQFFTAPDAAGEPGAWAQLGADVSGPSGALFVGTSSLACGAQSDGSSLRMAGRVYRAIVRSGIGGSTVADFNAANADTFALAADGYGNGWLIASPKHHGNWTLSIPKVYDTSGTGKAPATFGTGSNQPQWLPWKGVSGVYVSPAGNRITCAGSSTNVLTGDVEFVAQLDADLWNNPATQGVLFTSTGIEAYHLTSGAIRFRRLVSTVAKTYDVTLPSIPAGKTMWIRGRFDQDNGASASQFTLDVSHSEAPSEPSDWTTIGSATNADTGASDTPSGLSLAGFSASQPFAGVVRRFILRNGFGGALVADFVAASCGQSGYTDPAGLTWGVARASTGRKTVVQSPAARCARSVILHGTDDWIDVPAAAIPPLDTFAAPSAVAVVFRRWHNPGSALHPIFATKSANTAAVAGAAIRLGSVATSTQLGVIVGDGSAFDFTVVDDPNSVALGARAVVSAGAANVSPFLTLRANSGVATEDTSRGSTVTNSTGGAGRIGAYLGGTGAIDMEFEALATYMRGSMDLTHAALTAGYNGGQ